MRFLIAMSFWVGVALTISELHDARKGGTPISRREKLDLLYGVALVFVAMLVAVVVVGMEPQSVGPSILVCLSGVFNIWGLNQRIRRKARKASKPSAS